MTKDNYIALARSQDQRQLSKLLAYGLGGSLLLHGIAAVIFNYLPQQIPDNSVEVTLIDSSDLPPDFQSSPTPTPSITIATKPTPTPSVRVTPAPTPTPSVKITPTPTPTPSVKITPRPTPSVKIKPDRTPTAVKIVTQPSSSSQKPAKTQLQGNPESLTNSPVSVTPSPSDIALNNLPNPGQLPASDRSNPNGENAGKNSNTTNNQLNFSGGNNKSPLTSGNDRNSGNSSSSNLELGDKNGIGQNNSNTLSPGSEAPPDLGGDTGTSGNGNDEFSVIIPSEGGDSLFNSSIDQTDSNLAINQNNQSNRHGGGNSSEANPNSNLNNGLGNVARTRRGIIPGIANTAKQGLGNDQNIPGGALRNSGLRNNSGGDPPSKGNSNTGDGNGLGKNPGSSRNSQPSKLPGSGSIGLTPGGQESKGSFGIELACLKNCKPRYRAPIQRAVQVVVQIELNNSGQVISAKLSQSCNIPALDNFAEAKFKEMWFQLAPGLDKRIFIVTMDFKSNK